MGEGASRVRRAGTEIIALLVAVALLSATGIAFALPWRDRNPLAGSALSAYVDLRHGASFLSVKEGTDGEAVSWTSDNQVVVPGFRALTSWRDAPRSALETFVSGDEELTSTEQADRLHRVIARENRYRELTPDGAVSEHSMFSIADADGIHLVSFFEHEDQTDQVFDPPLLLSPSDLTPGRTWETTGTFNTIATYTYTGKVGDPVPFDGPAGRFESCLEIEFELAFELEGEPPAASSTVDVLCPGAGLVESREVTPDGETLSKTQLVGRDGRAASASKAPPPSPVDVDDSAPGDLESWGPSRLGRAAHSFDVSEATFAPVYVASDPPLVLAAGYGGDLVAYDARSGDGTVAWRFRTGGVVYGAPMVDPATGRVYIGSTDKRLYALDVRGLYLWSQPVGDSIATRPLVTNGIVVVGSGDRRVYGFDAADGTLRWTVATGGPVAGSPAQTERGLVVLGGDDGGVHAIDPASGERVWLADAGDAIEAGVVTDADDVYAGTWGGGVLALDADSGEERWTADVTGSVRSTLALDERFVYVLDDSGVLTALDRADGTMMWTSPPSWELAGTPLPLTEGLLVTSVRDGVVRLLDDDGGVLRTWDVTGARGTRDRMPAFEFGGTPGGDSVWLVDKDAVVYRLGPPTLAGAESLVPAWIITSSEPPFAVGDVPAYTPLEWRGRALLLDYHAQVFAADTADGAVTKLGLVAPDLSNPYAGGAVAGDTLLVAVGETLYARRLPDLEPLWEFDGGRGLAGFPPVVAGSTVLWVSGADDDTATTSTWTVTALDLVTGVVRWSADVPATEPNAIPGGPVVDGDHVYVGGTSFDLATGEVRWSAALDIALAGAPGLSDDGELLFVGGFDTDGAGAVAAVSTDAGRVAWQRDLGEDSLAFLERITPVGDVLVVPSTSTSVLGLAAADGRIRWRYELPAPILGTSAVEDGHVWLMTDNGHVHVVETTTGQLRTRFGEVDFPLSPYSYAQRPGRVQDRVVFAAGFFLMAFDLPVGTGDDS